MNTFDSKSKKFRRGQLVTVFWPGKVVPGTIWTGRPWLARYERRYAAPLLLLNHDLVFDESGEPVRNQLAAIASVEAITTKHSYGVPLIYLHDAESPSQPIPTNRRRRPVPFTANDTIRAHGLGVRLMR